MACQCLYAYHCIRRSDKTLPTATLTGILNKSTEKPGSQFSLLEAKFLSLAALPKSTRSKGCAENSLPVLFSPGLSPREMRKSQPDEVLSHCKGHFSLSFCLFFLDPRLRKLRSAELETLVFVGDTSYNVTPQYHGGTFA